MGFFLVHAGMLPFRAEAVMLMYDQIRTAPLAFPSGVPASPALVELLSRMLAKDPAHRLSLPHILAHPWVTQGCSVPLPGSFQVLPGP